MNKLGALAVSWGIELILDQPNQPISSSHPWHPRLPPSFMALAAVSYPVHRAACFPLEPRINGRAPRYKPCGPCCATVFRAQSNMPLYSSETCHGCHGDEGNMFCIELECQIENRICSTNRCTRTNRYTRAWVCITDLTWPLALHNFRIWWQG